MNEREGASSKEWKKDETMTQNGIWCMWRPKSMIWQREHFQWVRSRRMMMQKNHIMHGKAKWHMGNMQGHDNREPKQIFLPAAVNIPPTQK